MPELEIYNADDIKPLIPLPDFSELCERLSVRCISNIPACHYNDWWLNVLMLAAASAAKGQPALFVGGGGYCCAYSKHDRTVVSIDGPLPNRETLANDYRFAFDNQLAVYFEKELTATETVPQSRDNIPAHRPLS